jgi:hypothetical protein
MRIILRSQLVILTDSVCSELVTGLKKSKESNTRTEGTGGTAAGLVSTSTRYLVLLLP